MILIATVRIERDTRNLLRFELIGKVVRVFEKSLSPESHVWLIFEDRLIT